MVPLLLETCWKGGLLLAVAALGQLMLRRAPAAMRCLWLQGAVAALLLLPLLTPALPAWRVPLLPQTDLGRPAAAAKLPAAGLLADRFRPASAAPWLAAIWLAGSGLLFLRLLRSARGAHRIAARCSDAGAAPLEVMLERAQEELGIRRDVRLLVGAEDAAPAVPMTFGWIRPLVLLPRAAVDWPEERARAVLLHELGHIRRDDWVWRMAVETACALYWYNPLAWMLAARLREESEAACDDLVVLAGVRPSEYARQLLHVASALVPRRTVTEGVLTMARERSIETRIRAVLAPDAPRRSCTHQDTACVLALTGAVAAVLGAVQPVPVRGTMPAGVPEATGSTVPPRVTPARTPADPSASSPSRLPREDRLLLAPTVPPASRVTARAVTRESRSTRPSSAALYLGSDLSASLPANLPQARVEFDSNRGSQQRVRPAAVTIEEVSLTINNGEAAVSGVAVSERSDTGASSAELSAGPSGSSAAVSLFPQTDVQRLLSGAEGEIQLRSAQ